MTSGQKMSAPSTPSTSLKYGNSRASPVVLATYAVLKQSRWRFSL
uniref:Uncharacterized protein n=1 Tax=Arundo donax TaxID=35708 RepID=A0A0A9C7Y7_ARUDO